jgi:membrane protein implicated in regulation of membrane protease activity
MPVFGLPIFWLIPLSLAAPIYTALVVISGLLYWSIMKAMRKPLQDGFQSLTGTEAEVVSRLAPEHSAQYLVRSRGELWSAYTTDAFQPGEPANIVAVKGIGVVIERVNNGHDERGNAETIIEGAKGNERHCH